MFWTNTKRIIRAGFLGFWRNGVVSLSAVLVLVVALFMIGATILSSAFFNTILKDIKDKVDINIYLNIDTLEIDALVLKESLESLPEIDSVEYISKDAALEAFRQRHENDQLTLQALEELGENPLRPSLNVKAKDPSQYPLVATFLESDNVLSASGINIINDVNYSKNKVVIDRLTHVIRGVERLGLSITVMLIIIAVFITFNTIRLVIYISREEIGVMRLVGADNRYIRGPFIIEGVIYGIVAAIITALGLYPLTSWVRDATYKFYGGIDMFQYYVSNFEQIFAILMTSGVLLGAISSYLAVRRYLKGKKSK